MKISYPILKFFNSLHIIYNVLEKILYCLGNIISMRCQRKKMLKKAANNAYVKIISYILYLETSLKRPFKGQGEICLMFLKNELTVAKKYGLLEPTLFPRNNSSLFYPCSDSPVRDWGFGAGCAVLGCRAALGWGLPGGWSFFVPAVLQLVNPFLLIVRFEGLLRGRTGLAVMLCDALVAVGRGQGKSCQRGGVRGGQERSVTTRLTPLATGWSLPLCMRTNKVTDQLSWQAGCSSGHSGHTPLFPAVSPLLSSIDWEIERPFPSTWLIWTALQCCLDVLSKLHVLPHIS